MKKAFVCIIACLIVTGGNSIAQQKSWSLEECIKYAIDHNIQIKQQTIQTKVQQNALDQ